MALDAYQNRSIKPMKLKILNLKDSVYKDQQNMFNIAFDPNYPYSYSEYDDWLQKSGVNVALKRGKSLRYLKRSDQIVNL